MSNDNLKDIISELKADLADKMQIKISEEDLGTKNVSNSEKHIASPTINKGVKTH